MWIRIIPSWTTCFSGLRPLPCKAGRLSAPLLCEWTPRKRHDWGGLLCQYYQLHMSSSMTDHHGQPHTSVGCCTMLFTLPESTIMRATDKA
ncbi:hypothetical protein BDW68DRAFT_168205 [Aspergillus falconensis]